MAQGFFTGRKRSRDNCETDNYDRTPIPKRLHNMSLSEVANEGLVPQYIGHNHFEQGGFIDQHNGLQSLGNVSHSQAQFSEYLYAANGGNNNFSVLTPGGANLRIVDSSWNVQSPPNQEHTWMSAQILSHYMPDLTAVDNPYYYENNKVLFALHMERVQRGGPPFY